MELKPVFERFLRPVAIASMGIAALAGCAGDELDSPVTETTVAQETTVTTGAAALSRVVEVVDGDTVRIEFNGKTESVRLIGIDTPETVHPNEPVECFGLEASNHAKELLEGQQVEFVKDSKKDTRDRYGRLLGYLRLPDGDDADFEPDDFGLQMILGGYAFEYTYQGEEYDMQEQYKDAATQAKDSNAGLWAPDKCNGEQTPIDDEGSVPESTGDDTCEPDQIKGNINDDDEKIYHEPGSRYYDQTVINESAGEMCFATTEEAVAAGWRPAV